MDGRCNSISEFASGKVTAAFFGVVRVLLALWIGAVFSRVAITPGVFGLPDVFSFLESAVVVGITLAMAFGGGRGRT